MKKLILLLFLIVLGYGGYSLFSGDGEDDPFGREGQGPTAKEQDDDAGERPSGDEMPGVGEEDRSREDDEKLKARPVSPPGEAKAVATESGAFIPSEELLMLLGGVLPKDSSFFKYVSREMMTNPSVLDVLAPAEGDISTMFFKNDHRIEEMVQVASHLAGALSKCLKEDLCGLKEETRFSGKRGSSFGAMDRMTPAHELLNQSLMAMNLAMNRLGDQEESINVDDLVGMLDIKNKNTRHLAMGIIFKKGNEQAIAKTFDKAEKFSGRTAVNFIGMASMEEVLANDKLRDRRNDLLKHYVKNGDNKTINQLSKIVTYIDVDSDTAGEILKAYCAGREGDSGGSSRVPDLRFMAFANKHGLDMCR